jgi:hypothetical protein
MNLEGYTVDNGILTVTDMLDFHLSKQTYFYAHEDNYKRRGQAVTASISGPGADDIRQSKLFVGLQFDIIRNCFINPQTPTRFKPIPEIHLVYKRMAAALRAKGRALCNLGAFDLIPHPEKRLHQLAFLDIQETFEDTSAENIMRLITMYDCRSWLDQRNGVKITAYKNVDKALTKAINDYRDSWLDNRNGFELKEIT